VNTQIETHSGKLFDYLQQRPVDMDSDSIAHALGNICRFTGHCREFYSVAAHSLLCVELARKRDLSSRLCLLALVHDAHEAYVGDINSPLKRALNGNFADLDTQAALVAHAALGITPPTLHEKIQVKALDLTALMTEARVLMPSGGRNWSISEQPDDEVEVVCLPPKEGARRWLTMYKTMTTEVSGFDHSLGQSDASTTEPTANGGRRTDSETTTPTE
jgi:hypothetical protein